MHTPLAPFWWERKLDRLLVGGAEHRRPPCGDDTALAVPGDKIHPADRAGVVHAVFAGWMITGVLGARLDPRRRAEARPEAQVEPNMNGDVLPKEVWGRLGDWGAAV